MSKNETDSVTHLREMTAAPDSTGGFDTTSAAATTSGADTAAADTVASDLQWPPPMSDGDIFWLHPAAAPAHDGPNDSALATSPPPAVSSTFGSNDLVPDLAGRMSDLPGAVASIWGGTTAPLSALPPADHSISGRVAGNGSISVPLLLSSGAPYEWHDAVAFVQQLADEVLPANAQTLGASIPDLDAISLEPTGHVHARLVSSSGSESIVQGLGRVLGRLLADLPSPPNLRLLTWQATAEQSAEPTQTAPPATPALSLELLRQELARWERPGRAQKLTAWYQGARALQPEQIPAPIGASTTRMPIVPLPITATATARPLAEEQRAAHQKPAAPSRRTLAKTIGVAAACVAIAIASIGVARWSRSGRLGAADSPAAEVSLAEQQTTGAEVDRERPVSPTSNNTARPRASSRSSAGQPSEHASTARVASTAGEISVPPLTVKPIDSLAPANDLAISTPSSVAFRRIYQSGDSNVVEPILVHPYLPELAAGVPEDRLGVLELVIDVNGAVESVRLRTPANRYRERWWVFAAKSWQFQPASKDGRPVRFRKRIPITDLNLLEPQ